MTVRLLYLVSHPIQYQAPLLRLIAAQPDIRLRVIFQRDTSTGYFDPGFAREIRWDQPLRQGYDNVLATEIDLAAAIAETDVIWMHGWQGAWMRRALRLSRRLGKPVMMRGENTDDAMPDGGGWRGMAKRLYLRWLLGKVSVFLAIGSANRAYYLRRGIGEERIFMVPYAIDNARFSQLAQAADLAALRRDLGLPADQPVILYSGKFMPRKHPHTLLAAWRQAAWRDRKPCLIFVGDGQMSAELTEMAGGDPHIRLCGFRNQAELPAFYALADIFVLASEAEPWGLAVNEAMACGTAVVVGDRVGCADDLVDADCGRKVAAGDVQGLADALVQLLDNAQAAGNAATRKIAGWDFQADITGLRQALTWLETHPCG